MIIGIDVDSVVADLHSVWISRYNKDYNDNLSLDGTEITDWDTSKFVKKECGTKIYDYLKDPTLYDEIKPVEDSLHIIEQLKEDFNPRIIYITTTPIETPGVKFNWLVKYGFLKKDELHNYYECRDKSLIACNILLDDKYENARDAYRDGILFTRPWNKKYDYHPRINSWIEFYDYINSYYGYMGKQDNEYN
jgi:5'-nucleotidase